MSHKIFDNNLDAIRKRKVALKFNKPPYIVTCVLELSKVLLYEFHRLYIQNKYDNKSKLLFTNTDRWMYGIKTEDVHKGLKAIGKCLILVTIPLSQNTVMIKTIYLLGKWKIKPTVLWLMNLLDCRQRCIIFLVRNNTEYMKSKSCE